jgi:hypothetical protein
MTISGRPGPVFVSARSWVEVVTDGQSAYPPWCRAPLRSPWPDFSFSFLLPDTFFALRLEVEVTLWLTLSQSVCLVIEYPCGTCDGMLLSEICCLVSVGRPLWREDGSAICSVITEWSESLRSRNHTLLSPPRLLQPGGPGFRIYIPQEHVILPGTGFPLRRLLRLAGLRWRYSNPPGA